MKLRIYAIAKLNVFFYFYFVAFAVSSILYVVLTYIPEGDIAAAAALITLCEAISSVQVVGILINHIDLSPNFCGVLMGIANCLGSITSIVAPLTVQFVVTDEVSVVANV